MSPLSCSCLALKVDWAEEQDVYLSCCGGACSLPKVCGKIDFFVTKTSAPHAPFLCTTCAIDLLLSRKNFGAIYPLVHRYIFFPYLHVPGRKILEQFFPEAFAFASLSAPCNIRQTSRWAEKSRGARNALFFPVQAASASVSASDVGRDKFRQLFGRREKGRANPREERWRILVFSASVFLRFSPERCRGCRRLTGREARGVTGRT